MLRVSEECSTLVTKADFVFCGLLSCQRARFVMVWCHVSSISHCQHYILTFPSSKSESSFCRRKYWWAIVCFVSTVPKRAWDSFLFLPRQFSVIRSLFMTWLMANFCCSDLTSTNTGAVNNGMRWSTYKLRRARNLDYGTDEKLFQGCRKTLIDPFWYLVSVLIANFFITLATDTGIYITALQTKSFLLVVCSNSAISVFAGCFPETNCSVYTLNDVLHFIPLLVGQGTRFCEHLFHCGQFVGYSIVGQTQRRRLLRSSTPEMVAKRGIQVLQLDMSWLVKGRGHFVG